MVTKKPLKIIKGIIVAGIRAIAISNFGQIIDIKNP